MPKKKKQPRKPSPRPSPIGPHNHDAPPGWTPEALAAASHIGMSRCLSHVPDEAWERLRAEFIERQPACPDCGAAWDLDSANEEEGETFDGHHIISISTCCTSYNADEEAGLDPAPHPISDGLGEHELTLA